MPARPTGGSATVAIDVLATAPHYVDHLLPIWAALPPDERRYFYLGPRAHRDGIPGARALEYLGRDTKAPVLTVAHGDFKVARTAGRRRLALGQHGAGQSYSTDHPSYPGGRDQAEVSLFLVPNRYAADRTIEAYPEPASRSSAARSSTAAGSASAGAPIAPSSR
jgi:hypothetical protein